MNTLANPSAPAFAGSAGPVPWSQFKSEIGPLFEYPLVSRKHAGRFRQVVRELEALDLAVDGGPPRPIASTADIGLTLVARYIASRPAGQSPHYLQSLLNVVRTIASLAVRSGYLAVSPFAVRPISKLVRTPPLAGKRCLTADEVRRLLELAARDVAERTGWGQWRSRRLLAMLATAAFTGMRAGEVKRLQVDDIDLAGRIIHVRPHDGEKLKTAGSEAPIVIPAALVPYLTEWLEHRLDRPHGFHVPAEVPYCFPTINLKAAWTSGIGGRKTSGTPGTKPLDRLKALGRRIGIEVTWQILRRTWCTVAEARGIQQAQITRQARHSSEAITRRWYQQRDLDALTAAVSGFDFS